jgi:hypothetical protein
LIRTIAVVALLATSACADTILSADYTDPTDRYTHGILGDAIEWGGLRLHTETGPRQFTLPQDRVFEDVAPRLVDLDNDRAPEVVVVETLNTAGAQLAVYDATGKIAATPHIGRTNRWLAPIGATDLDGDGMVEIAYIDRPHLAKTLRVWRFTDGALVHVADLDGLTNHRIGESDIGGGIRDCGQGPEMITASADWTQVMATTLAEGRLETRALGPYRDRSSFAAALACEAVR